MFSPRTLLCLIVTTRLLSWTAELGAQGLDPRTVARGSLTDAALPAAPIRDHRVKE
jgi:hypothetical protein